MSTVQDFVIIDIPSGNCALCRQQDGYVVDTIVAGQNDPTPRPGYYLISIELNTPVTIGCRWDGTQFLDSTGNVLTPLVPETKCAVIDSNSYVIDLATAQVAGPFLYNDNVLMPIPADTIVQKGFYWSNGQFILPINGNRITLNISKSEKTKDFLNKIIIEDISNTTSVTRPCGLVSSIEYGETFDTLQLINVMGEFFIGNSVSNTETYIDCPNVIQVLKE